jgi:hypothetical protein
MQATKKEVEHMTIREGEPDPNADAPPKIDSPHPSAPPGTIRDAINPQAGPLGPRGVATLTPRGAKFASNSTDDGATVKVTMEEARVLFAQGMITVTPTIVGMFDPITVNGAVNTINGSGFGAQGANSQVTIGGVVQTITSWTPTRIVITAVQGANVLGVAANLVVRNQAMQTATLTGVKFVNPPDAPTGVVATAPGGGNITLTWVAPAVTGGQPIAGYQIANEALQIIIQNTNTVAVTATFPVAVGAARVEQRSVQRGVGGVEFHRVNRVTGGTTNDYRTDAVGRARRRADVCAVHERQADRNRKDHAVLRVARVLARRARADRTDQMTGEPGEVRATITVTRASGKQEIFTLIGRVPVDHSARGDVVGAGAELTTGKDHGSDTLSDGA